MLGLELTRFHGHPKLLGGGVHDAESKTALYARVPSPGGGASRTPEDLAKEFEPTAQSIRNWVCQADVDKGRRHDGLKIDEREELRRLRRENRQLRLEREILAKAAAWFARETDSMPPKSSSSMKVGMTLPLDIQELNTSHPRITKEGMNAHLLTESPNLSTKPG